MIPCRQLRLEVLVPDPSTEYFVIERDEIGGQQVIAPRYIQLPNDEVGINTFDLPAGEYKWGFYSDLSDVGVDLDRLTWNEKCETPRTWGEVKAGDEVCADIEPPDPICENGYCWMDIISNSTEITVDRGFDLNQSVVGRPETGTLIADIADPSLNALQASGLGIGQRVRLRVVEGDYEEIIFQGVATAISSYNNAIDTPMVYLEAVDALAQLNGVLIDQGRPQETYEERIRYAASQIPGLPITVTEGTQTLNEMLEPLTALEMIVQSQDSEGSVVWINKENAMFSTNREWEDTIFGDTRMEIDSVPTYAFTNALTGENTTKVGEKQVCLSSFVQTSDTRQVINGVTFYNYEIEERENSEGEITRTEIPKTYTFSDSASARLYGSADIRLTTRLDPDTLAGYASYIFDQWSIPKTKIESIEWPADRFDSIFIPDTIELDIGDAVRIALKDPLIDDHLMVDQVQRIARIKHEITPNEWLIRTELI